MGHTIARARLANQLLGSKKLETPAQVVAWLGAVQAQDYGPAKWALGMRVHAATDRAVEAALNEGAILRTHVMRPTWHFLAPRDIRWVQALTRNRAHAANASMARKLELDGKVLARCHRVLEDALRGGKHRTRTELAEALAARRIQASGQRLAYILMHAEFEALICSGPRRGKQFTYTLIEERVPPSPVLPADEALARWTLRYFRSHGPAQPKDFAWWSGLTLEQTRRGLEMVDGELSRETVDGRTYWCLPGGVPPRRRRTQALLLSIYDEYTIAYRDRSALGAEPHIERLIAMGNALTSVLVLDGAIAGTWKRAIGKEAIEMEVKPFGTLRKEEKEAVEAAAIDYGAYHEIPVTLRFA